MRSGILPSRFTAQLTDRLNDLFEDQYVLTITLGIIILIVLILLLFRKTRGKRIPRVRRNRLRPTTGGRWTGKPGDSTWRPNPRSRPQRYNPDNLTWKRILKRYRVGRGGIGFRNNEPDFLPCVLKYNGIKCTVRIDNFSAEREDNFNAADEALAKKLDASVFEIKGWRYAGYTWHERSDRKTLDLVPTEVHANIPHQGGIAAEKQC
jgi:hypothetical protein